MRHAMETPQVVYWHRELPPLDAVADGEHTIEADSPRVPGTIAHRDELWDQCQHGLSDDLAFRLRQEVARLGGRCVHVLDERIEVKHDAVSNDAWLHGRYTYVLYR
jgi:hypothetical protein